MNRERGNATDLPSDSQVEHGLELGLVVKQDDPPANRVCKKRPRLRELRSLDWNKVAPSNVSQQFGVACFTSVNLPCDTLTEHRSQGQIVGTLWRDSDEKIMGVGGCPESGECMILRQEEDWVYVNRL
jgi:hypothetical protein